MKLRIGFIGIKGGVGKTTLALSTAFYLSRKYKVLYIDKDLLSLGSLILGFNGVGFHKALADNLDKEQYEKRINDNFTLFKVFSSPVSETKLHEVVRNDKLTKAYLDVVNRNYDVIIVDYGRIFSISDPLVYDEYELFRIHFPEYTIAGIGITDAVLDDILSSVEYFENIRKKIGFKPLAFVINMVPQIDYVQKEIAEEVKRLRQALPCEVVTIPFIEEVMQYNNLGNREEMQIIGKIIEKYLEKS